MKKISTLLAAVLVAATLWAQSPEKISYQAVIRNNSNALVTNTQIGMQISILQGGVSGTAVYVETQTPNTNGNGLVSVEIGAGNTSDDFASIDWANGPYFIKTETDISGGSNYSITGVSQLLSVPYALHAKTADELTGGIVETDPAYTASQAAKITATDITNLANLSGTNTGDQDLSGLATKTEVATGLATKVDVEAGKGLSTNDYTTAEQTKLAGVATGAEANVNADWNATSGDAQILNKPAIPSAEDLVNLSNLSGVNTGDQDLSGLATKTEVTTGLATKVDVEAGKGLSTNDYTTAEKSKLAAITGTNTGDQDLSDLATKTEVTTGLATKVDVEAGKGLSTNDYTTAEKSKLAAISGTNTGDQDLSGLATKKALADSTAKVRSEIPDVSGFLSTEADPVFSAWDKSSGISITESQISDLDHFTNADETDPVFSAWDKSTGISISESQISDLDHFTNADEIDPRVPTGNTAGDMQYWNGSAWVTVAAGNEGQVLTFSGGVPTWKTQVEAGDVKNPITGKIWMDRNLGASQVATSSSDAAAYGDLYQWGRAADGHQLRTSAASYTMSATDTPGHGDIIIGNNDWRSPRNDNLWQGVSGTNNPCPSGYRLPTKTEWEAEIATWSSQDAAGAFASPLKLPMAGVRGGGTFYNIGSEGGYWSSTVSGASSANLSFTSSSANMSSTIRAVSFSVRCIKE